MTWYINILSQFYGVNIDRFWINDRIYWTLCYSSWLNFTVHCYTHTHARMHTLVSTVTSSLPLLTSGFQRRTFPFLWVPELSPTSATSSLTDSLSHQPTDCNEVKAKVILQAMVNRSVCFGVKLPSGLLVWVVLSDERTALSFTAATGHR
jgi:hypothetical protein